MKKSLLLLCTILMFCAAAGCAQAPQAASPTPEATPLPPVFDAQAVSQGYANEILSYTRIDPARTLLFVSKTGNVDLSGLIAAFEAAHPDVQVVSHDITGGVGEVRPAMEWIQHGDAPDIMFTQPDLFHKEAALSYLEDLSANPILEHFNKEMLVDSAVDSKIVWLPGPVQLDCLHYNQTLFKQYGWEIPTSFDAFVALCKQIKADTNGEIQPWNPNAKYSGDFLRAIDAIVYQELYAGLQNRTWYEEFLAGNGTFAGHMEPYYEALQTLIDNGILLEEHFSYSATTRGKEFEAGKIAMINSPMRLIDNDAFDFGRMPFPSTMDTVGFLPRTMHSYIGIPKKQRSDAQQGAIDRFLAFFCSTQGQDAFVGEQFMASSIQDAPFRHAELIPALLPAIEQGNLFAPLDYYGPLGGPAFSLYDQALALCRGETTPADCIAAVDAAPYPVPAESQPVIEAPSAVGTATESFTMLETSCFLADFYREAADADIGLIVHGVAYRGNLMRIFEGALTPTHLTVLKPRSFDNDATLVKLSMTGQQLMDALNDPVNNVEPVNCLYAYSGLRGTVAPWAPMGEKYRSVTLSDGTAIEPNKRYTVAAWGGTVREEYITETLAHVEGSFESLLTQKLAQTGSIAPAKDGRITLVWN